MLDFYKLILKLVFVTENFNVSNFPTLQGLLAEKSAAIMATKMSTKTISVMSRENKIC